MSTMRIPTEFLAIDKFSSVVSKMISGVSGFSKTTEASIERVNRKLGKVSLGFAVAGTAILGLGGVAVNASNTFEKSMNNVSTLVDTNAEDMGKMGDAVLKMASRIPVPIEELTSSLYSIRSAGIPAGEAMETLSNAGELAVTGLATAAEATDVMTSAMNAFKAEGKTSREIAISLFKAVRAGKTDISQIAVGFGDVAPAAVAAGVTINQLSAATAALTLGGMKTAGAQTKLKSLFDESTKSSGKLAESYHKIAGGNIAVDVKSKGFMKVLENLKKSVGGNEIAFKNMFSSQEAGAAALSLMGTGNKAYTDTLASMESGTDDMAIAFDKQARGGASQAQIAKNNMEALSITIGSVLAPMVSSLIQKVVPLVSSFREWAGQNKGLIKTIGVIGGVLLGLSGVIKGVQFVMVAGQAIMYAYTAIMSVYSGVAVTAALTGASFAAVIWATVWPVLAVIAAIAAIIAIFYYWDEIVAWFSKQWETFVNWISGLWTSVVDAFKSFDFMNFFKSIGQGIIDFMLLPLKTVLELLSKIPGGIGEMASSALSGINAMTDLGVTSEVLPSPEQKQAENLQNVAIKGGINVDIRDKGNNVAGVSSNKGGGIPINLSSTQGAF